MLVGLSFHKLLVRDSNCAFLVCFNGYTLIDTFKLAGGRKRVRKKKRGEREAGRVDERSGKFFLKISASISSSNDLWLNHEILEREEKESKKEIERERNISVEDHVLI